MPKKRFTAQYSKPASTAHPSLNSAGASSSSGSREIYPTPSFSYLPSNIQPRRQRCRPLRERSHYVSAKIHSFDFIHHFIDSRNTYSASSDPQSAFPARNTYPTRSRSKTKIRCQRAPTASWPTTTAVLGARLTACAWGTERKEAERGAFVSARYQCPARTERPAWSQP